MKTFADMANPWVAGLSVYEPGRSMEEVAREGGFADPNEIVKLASNENALGPSPLALAAMARGAAGMHRYPDGGARAFRAALAKKLDVGADCVLPGNGSNELLEMLGHAFLGPDSEVVVADRAFVVYRLIAESFRAGVVTVPMRRLTHDLPAMLRAVTPKTKIVFVGNPNNPTGTVVGREAISEFMRELPDHVLVCFDEAYAELMPPGEQPATLRYVREGRHVAVLRTFSKTYGLAGLRLGYAVAPPECVSLLNRVRQPFNVNAMALAAGVAALDDDAHVERTRRMVREGIRQMQSDVERLGLSYVPTAANFMLVKVGRGREVFESLLRRGVIVRPMDGYALPEYVRVTVGTFEENARFVAALRAVLAGGDAA